MRTISLSCALLVLVLALGTLTSSCHYHLGTNLKYPNICLDELENPTSESLLTPNLRDAIQSEISRRPSLKLTSPDKAQTFIDIKIISLDFETLARAEIRDAKNRNDDSDAYQAVVHRATLVFQATVVAIDDQNQKITLFDDKITAIGDMPRQADRKIALDAALKQACLNGAKQLLSSLEMVE